MQNRFATVKKSDNAIKKITLIETPSAYQTGRQFKAAFDKAPLATLFYENAKGNAALDIHKAVIARLGLMCFDVGVYFDPFFTHIKNILNTGPSNTKEIMESSDVILIFSNKEKEIAKLYKNLKPLMGQNERPILLATELDLDVAQLNQKVADSLDVELAQLHPKIAEIISTKNYVTANILSFWSRVKDEIPQLKIASEPDNSAHLKLG